MTKNRSTKKALLSSALCLLLCFTMLIGTTFAWFTDKVEVTGNRIVAGNLDVEMFYKNAATSDWTNVNKVPSEKPTFFLDKNGEQMLWEPGAVSYATFKVANVGNLALKYTLETIAENYNTVTVGGEKYSLKDALTVGVIDGEATLTDRAAAITAVKTAGSFDDFEISDETLAPAGKGTSEKVFTVVIYWEPDADDNIFNINNDKTVDSLNGDKNQLYVDIDFCLTATQATVEYDSFGIDYDALAIYADAAYELEEGATFEDVLGNINDSEDETVLLTLNDDISWETGAAHGSTPWLTADSKVKTLIVDGNGHTITAGGAGVGPIRAANEGLLVIKNATIVDKSESYAEDSWEFTYLEFGGSLRFENVEFTSGIMIGNENGEDGFNEVDYAEFINCTFNSDADSEYSAWVNEGSAIFSGCTFTGTRALKAHEDYGSEIGVVTVDNCTFDNISKKPGVVLGTLNADTTVTIKNSDFINCQAGDQGKYIYETDTAITAFNFSESNNQIVKQVKPDLEISTAEQLFAFAKSVNEDGNSYSGKLVVLTADIDLENASWTPVGQTGGYSSKAYFQGIFDGQGFTISNLNVTHHELGSDQGKNYASGLFGFIDAADAVVKNLNVNTATVNGHHWVGVIAGYITGKISDCTVTNATVKNTHINDDACGDKAGVITGYINNGTVTGNTVQNCTVIGSRDAGQVVGAAKTTQAYGNTIYSVTVSAAGDCTGANVRNEEIGRIMS